jgi:pyruvate kinase
MPFPNTKLLKRRRTKIVATVGPASVDPGVLKALIGAGVNVFRLNMSHGDHAAHRLAFERIRAAGEQLREPVAVLADLCGPKLRVGRFADGQVELTPGTQVTVTTRDVVGGPGRIPSQYQALAQDVRPGNRILLDDGLLELRVESAAGSEVSCTVVFGGILRDRKGMNLPGVQVSAPSFTDKDRDDARFALALGVDALALSFVRRAADVVLLKEFIASAGARTPVIAKIEKPEALAEIDAILAAAEGIMVARGDLGVELPPEVVPIAQQELVARARAANRPVIVATQMLESMIEHPRPTRAEVSDVSHAVFAGADAVMLSAETAAGKYPVEAVTMMDRVARQVEGWQWAEGAFRSLIQAAEPVPPLPLALALARSTARLSRDLHVRTLVVLSRTGTTAAAVSGARPAAPILAVTTDAATCRRMNVLWGVYPVLATPADLKHPHALARQLARTYGLIDEGQYILLIAGLRAETAESEPVVTVLQV